MRRHYDKEFKAKVALEAVRDRAKAVEAEHAELSIRRRCELLSISRTAYYYQPKEADTDPELAALLAILDEPRERPWLRL